MLPLSHWKWNVFPKMETISSLLFPLSSLTYKTILLKIPCRKLNGSYLLGRRGYLNRLNDSNSYTWCSHDNISQLIEIVDDLVFLEMFFEANFWAQMYVQLVIIWAWRLTMLPAYLSLRVRFYVGISVWIRSHFLYQNNNTTPQCPPQSSYIDSTKSVNNWTLKKSINKYEFRLPSKLAQILFMTQNSRKKEEWELRWW